MMSWRTTNEPEMNLKNCSVLDEEEALDELDEPLLEPPEAVLPPQAVRLKTVNTKTRLCTSVSQRILSVVLLSGCDDWITGNIRSVKSLKVAGPRHLPAQVICGCSRSLKSGKSCNFRCVQRCIGTIRTN